GLGVDGVVDGRDHAGAVALAATRVVPELLHRRVGHVETRGVREHDVRAAGGLATLPQVPEVHDGLGAVEDLDVEELLVTGAGVPLPRERGQLPDHLGQVGEVAEHLGAQVAGAPAYDVGHDLLGRRVTDPV